MDREERTAKAEKAEPMENTDRNDPTEPIESTEPTEPIESTEPLQPIDSNDLSDQSDQPDTEPFVPAMGPSWPPPTGAGREYPGRSQETSGRAREQAPPNSCHEGTGSVAGS